MEKYSFKKAQNEALELQKITNDSKEKKNKSDELNKKDYENAENTLERPKNTFNEEGEDSKEILKEIEKKILNNEICVHSVSAALDSILEEGINANRNSVKAIEGLQNVFQHGIWSFKKREIDRKSKNRLGGKIWQGYSDLPAQEYSEWAAKNVFGKMSEYLEKKKAEGIDIGNISYDEMFKDIENTKGKPKHKSLKYIIESPRTKIAFNYLKRGGTGNISKLMTDPKMHFGFNLISSLHPKFISKIYNEEGQVSTSSDSLGILFKMPNKSRVHRLDFGDDDNPFELGISNKISPKEFVAVVINKKIDIDKVPKEVFDIIPKNLPIISSDLKMVIRMPKENDGIKK